MAAMMAPEQAELGLRIEVEQKDKKDRMRAAGIRPPSDRGHVARWEKVRPRSRLHAFWLRLREALTS